MKSKKIKSKQEVNISCLPDLKTQQVMRDMILALEDSRLELKKEKEKSQEYLDIVGVMVIIIDKKGKVALINKKGCEILGCEKENIIGKDWFLNFLPRDIQKITKSTFQKIITGQMEGVEFYENPVVNKQGQERLISWHNTVLKDEKGKAYATLSAGEDITEKTTAQQKLIQSEIRFRNIFEQGPIGIIQVGLDKKFKKINKEACNFWGYTERELLKMTFADITHPEDVKKDIANINQLIAGKINSYFVEKRYIRKDKKIVWGSVRVTVMKDEAGKPLYLLVAVADITKIKINEIKLKEAENRYSTLVEKSNDGIVLIKDGVVTFANEKMSTILGYSNKEIAGNEFLVFVAPEFRSEVSARYVQRQDPKIFKAYERFNLINKDYKNIPVEVSVSLLTLNNEMCMMAVVRDVSKAYEIERLRSEFISIASHQMRTPLTGMKWFLELLLTQKAGELSEKQLDYIDQVRISNERMINLVDDLLDVSRAEDEQKYKIVKKKQNIVKLLHEVIKAQKIISDKKSIKIVCAKLPKDQIMLSFDKEKMSNVFQNIIDNAIKYSPTKSTIKIGCKKKADEIIFSVADSGVGIPKDQQHKIFERFFRADNVASTQGGTGLGLYIAKYIVDRHGGKIWFESKENKGSTFYVSLPINK